MIPKVIHYCWFGRNSLPKDAIKCIESWKKYCPDYEVIEWNEDNYDITKNQYMADAYREKKWAFVSDYARIDVIHEYGGIYMDTDVELLKPLDDFLDCELFGGWENRKYMDEFNIPYENSVNFGLGFGAEKGNRVLYDLLKFYENISFYNDDGSLNLLACPHYQTEILKGYGLNISERSYQEFNKIVIYPETFFSPKSQLTGEITITKDTTSIHHFSMTWQSKEDIKFQRLEWKLSAKYGYSIAHKITFVRSIPYRFKRKTIKLIKKLFKW